MSCKILKEGGGAPMKEESRRERVTALQWKVLQERGTWKGTIKVKGDEEEIVKCNEQTRNVTTHYLL